MKSGVTGGTSVKTGVEKESCLGVGIIDITVGGENTRFFIRGVKILDCKKFINLLMFLVFLAALFLIGIFVGNRAQL